MKTTKDEITRLTTALIGSNHRTTVVGQLKGLIFETALFVILAAAAYFLASHEWQRGMVAGLAIGGVLSLSGKAVRRAKLAQAIEALQGTRFPAR